MAGSRKGGGEVEGGRGVLTTIPLSHVSVFFRYASYYESLLRSQYNQLYQKNRVSSTQLHGKPVVDVRSLLHFSAGGYRA